MSQHDHHDHESHKHEHTPKDAVEFAKPKTPWTDWLPLIVVISYIIGLTLITSALTESTLFNVLSYGMGYFFVIFSLFKLINLPGFAMGYHEYDIISKRWYNWGYIAPLVELALGVLYLLKFDSPFLHLATIVFSIIIVIGVGIKLAKKETFICACLGTVLKVPLTKVSLVEYLFMAFMAVPMLLGIV